MEDDATSFENPYNEEGIYQNEQLAAEELDEMRTQPKNGESNNDS